MYDTVKMKIAAPQAEKIIGSLKNPKVTRDMVTNDFVSACARYRNLRVWTTGEVLNISGSLSKFYYGNNLRHLSLKDTRLAFQKLEDKLGLNLQIARVIRVDIGFNFIMEHEVRKYLPHLTYAARYQHDLFNDGTGCRFVNSLRHLVFYDKIFEMQHTNSKIPPEFQGKNVLRYEVQLLKKLSQLFRLDELTVAHLLDVQFRQLLLKRYRWEFQQIHKHDKNNIPKLDFKNQSTLKNTLAKVGAAYVGQNSLFNELRVSRDNGTTGRKQASRILNAILGLTEIDSLENYPSLMELDAKISNPNVDSLEKQLKRTQSNPNF